MVAIVEALSLVVVVLTSVYLIVLSVTAVLFPHLATRFFGGFASSARLHYVELVVRLVIGGALVTYAPKVIAAQAFALFGWILISTTLCMFLVPWRQHRRFALLVVPRVSPYMRVVGLFSLALGLSLLAALIHGSAA